MRPLLEEFNDGLPCSMKQYLISNGTGLSVGWPTTNKNRKRAAEEESAYANSKLLIV